MAPAESISMQYYRGEFPSQKGVVPQQRIETIRTLLERVLADHDRLEFRGIDLSMSRDFRDESGRPHGVTIVLDGKIRIEEPLYSEVFDGDEAKIAESFLLQSRIPTYQ